MVKYALAKITQAGFKRISPKTYTAIADARRGLIAHWGKANYRAAISIYILNSDGSLGMEAGWGGKRDGQYYFYSNLKEACYELKSDGKLGEMIWC